MNLSKLKASMAVAAMALVSYSPAWAQEIIQDGCFPNCGGTDGGTTGGGGNGVPELDGPGVLVLVAIGIAVAVAIARRK